MLRHLILLSFGLVGFSAVHASAQAIYCASDDGNRHYCNADIRGGEVRMVRQRSGSACVLNRTYGFDRRGIWVDRGCRADFVIRPVAVAPPPVGRPAQILRCSSDDGGRRYCNADTRGGVRLARQVSGTPCRFNSTWGYDRRGVWVDRGCRADFEIGGGFRR